MSDFSTRQIASAERYANALFQLAKEAKVLDSVSDELNKIKHLMETDADFALTIKEVVTDKVNEGLSEKEIYYFLSDKYGDWILFNTPLKKNSYLLWFMPYVLFILGGVILYIMIKKRTEKIK